MGILHLPLELLLQVASYLPPRDRLNLCATSRELYHDDELRFSAAYWRQLTKATFRVPSFPVAHTDGRRWARLYRRFMTQSRVYTWGNNDHGSLIGGQIRTRHVFHRGAPNLPPLVMPTLHPDSASWPLEAREECMQGLGVISDIQCGGWSTILLNSKGQLFVSGVLNGESFPQTPSLKPSELEFPPGYRSASRSAWWHNPFTAISQFSAGRAHVLGLSDTGRMWSWDNHHLPAIAVKFLGVDLMERYAGVPLRARGCVRKVVGGWNRSSAFVNGEGIVVWKAVDNDAIRRQETSGDGSIDSVLIMSHWTVPQTKYFADEKNTRYDVNADGSQDVTNWILLEQFVVFVTASGKAFASKIPDEGETSNRLIELTTDDTDPQDAVADIQGSFRTFAIFKRNGEVLIGDSQFIDARWAIRDATPTSTELPKLRRIPALQHSGVIAMAFGDYHFHALHSNGRITSYGKEPQFCGSLGLGGLGIDVVRGLTSTPMPAPNPFFLTTDGHLLGQCQTTGRTVHFETEKREWLNYIRIARADRQEAEARVMRCFNDLEVRAEMSEWLEQRLRSWEDVVSDPNDDSPSHFALSVAAAGWHSGALVLIDEEKAERAREYYHTKAEDPTDWSTQVVTSPDSAMLSYAGTLFNIPAMIMSFGRWFLGLPPVTMPTREREPVCRHRWENESLPRLRLRSGEVLPGTRPIVDSCAPEWLPVEMVDL